MRHISFIAVVLKEQSTNLQLRQKNVLKLDNCR